MTARTDTSSTASAKRSAGVGAAVLVLTPAFGVAAAVAALPLFVVAVLAMGAALSGGSLLALATRHAERDAPHQG